MRNYKLALPCLRGVIGNWVYYSSLMTAKQISDSVSTVKEIREAESLDEVLQRKLKERKHDIARYLLSHDSRFFNSIILGVFDGVPDWIEFDLTKKFLEVLDESDIENSESSMGIMIFDGNEKIFAIDGQHRVEGIKIALEKAPEKVKDDQYSVLFIAHIDDEEGRKRTRRLFSDINTNAKPVSKGDRIIIDEDDISAIVARKLYSDYSFFKADNTISVSEQSNLDKDDSTHFTNLVTLHTVNRHLKKLFKIPAGTKPNDLDNVEALFKIATDFYDFMFNNLTDYKSYFLDSALTLIQARANNSHLLFRPIGLILMAKIYVYYKLNNIDTSELLNLNKLSFVFPASYLENILWNNGSMEVRQKNQNLAFDLTLYMLNRFPSDKEDSLLNAYKSILKNVDATLPAKVTDV
ncbi:DGQHR domain-containing protein [Flavobacterium sp.]|uniref:DGQHR domain-containing protein n=1 Tax=Flavobacterium sp. TaxID=239 RepID=UPI00261B8345|nr:DGQHR domain-containing protein [Flavobacterium sp.]